MDDSKDIYHSLFIKNIPRKLEDVVSEIAFRFGATGISEDLSFSQMDSQYTPEIHLMEQVHLIAYFDQSPAEEFFKEIGNLHKAIEVVQKTEENKDWLEEWKKDFKPFQLVEDYWVVPTWCEAPPEVRTPLFIDPGMAFGTGTHETTQLASEMLLKIFHGKKESLSAIDVGTGTGILALLMEKLGGKNIIATEIDDVARDVARENLKQNRAQQIEVPNHQIEGVVESFDLVVANIIDGVLLGLKPHLLRVCAKGGTLLLTGILDEREKDFRRQFEEGTTLKLQNRSQKSEWIALLYSNGEGDPL